MDTVRSFVKDSLTKVTQQILMKDVTWSELVSLRDNNQLIKGTQYRIIDYACTTAQADTQSANHPFDIIVTADSENTLNENARAIQHSGDTYFANSNLATWELKYSLDNDTTKFAWADSTNGKGVIYRMIDEFNNDVPYDFKNIQYAFLPSFECKLYGVTHTYTKNGDVITLNGVDYYGYTRTRTSPGPPAPTTPLYVTYTTLTTYMPLYTISGDTATIYSSATIDSVNNQDYISYTFAYTDSSVVYDASISGLSKGCYNNIIGEYYSSNKQQLNFNIFYSTNNIAFSCFSNTFGNNCYRNTFGSNCFSNTFGDHCLSNTFDNNCYRNTFGNNCYSNTFGNGCLSNTFGDSCRNNTFSTSCQYNTFGNSCQYNTFGNSCQYNTFGDYCDNNTFGNYFQNNTLGESVQYFITGNATGATTSAQTKNYIQYLIVENGVQNVNVYCTGTTSSSNYCQNIKIGLGVKGASSVSMLQIDITSQIGATASVTYQPANTQIKSI